MPLSPDSQPPASPSSSHDPAGGERLEASAFARSEQDQFRRLFEHAPALIAVLSGPLHVYTFANPRYMALFGKRALIGKPIREALPELAGQGYFEILDQVYRTGESYIAEADRVFIDRDNNGRLEQAYFHITFQATRGAADVVDGILIHALEVTEHVQARDELQRSKERYEALARTRTQFVWGTGPSGQVDDMPEWRAFTGQTEDEVRGMGWGDAVHPADRAAALLAWNSAVQAKALYEVEYRAVHAEGGYRWLHVRGLPVLEPDGAIREWVGVASDVTEQREAQAALLEANETLSAQRAELQAQQAELSSLYEQLRHRHVQVQSERDRLFELSLDLVATADSAGYLTDVNPAWTKTLGWTADELKSRPFLDFVVPEDRARSEAELRKLLVEGQPTLQFQTRFLTKEGEIRALDWRGYADQGVIYAIARDVTERHRFEAELLEANGRLTALAEERRAQTEALQRQAREMTEQRQALEESEERYRGLFEASRDALVTASLDRGILEVNPAFVEKFGYTLDEVLGRDSAFLYHSHDAYVTAGRQVTADLDRREPVVFEADMKRKDGSVLPVEVSSYVLRDPEGRPSRLVGVLRDLTSQRQVERQREAHNRELAAQKAFAESLIQNIPTGVAYLDRDLVFRVVNPVYAEFVKVPADGLVGRHVFEALPGDQAQIEAILLRVLETGEPFYAREFPFVYRTPDGAERTTYWDFVYYPVRATEEEPVQGIFALADEISHQVEQERAQRRLKEEQARLQQERLEALEQSDKLKDQFLSILSHELRTPINAIMGFGSVLGDEVVGPLTPEQQAYTGKILSSADALLALIEDLLIVSRVQAGKFSVSPQRARFEDLVESALETQEPAAAKKAISVINHVPGDLPAIAADPLRIIQVLNNLLGNAFKFTPQCGQVVVRAIAEGGMIRCEVADTGIGIAAADQPRLFQRFSQLDMSNTRSAGGAGLGLSIVKAIVNAHGGEVGLSSEPGQGATFWFTLPIDA